MLSNKKVWILGIVLLLGFAYYRLLARPLFQQEHAQSFLPHRVRSMAVVAWLAIQLQRVREKAIPYIVQLYDNGILYRDALKVIVNFMQIVGSFARHAHMPARLGARMHPCTQDWAKLPE